ncbi:MAG: ABC transporter ATP-binding protein [Oscillospiraceae bacterium]|nr:ABC transporter ATP-binding protein [Oscillospiraceae bacterium]
MSKNKLLVIGIVAVIIGAVVSEVIPPLVLEEIVNRLTDRENIAFQLIMTYFLLLAMSNAFNALKQILITIFGQKITHGMRSGMCAKLTRLPADYFVSNKPGAVVSRFVGDADTLESLFTKGIIGMAIDALKIIGILAVVFTKSAGLGILMTVSGVPLFFITKYFRKKMLGAQLKNRAAISKANSYIPEAIKNIRTIHAYAKEEFMEEKYDGCIKDSFDAINENNFLDSSYSPIIPLLSTVLIAVMMICSAMGGELRSFFGMSVGTAVAVISYVTKVFKPLEEIAMEIQSVQSAIAGVRRINEFFEEEEREIPMLEGFPEKLDSTDIKLEDVHFGYNEEHEVIKGTTFCVNSGEFATLTGRTGLGKSTIFKLILGLYKVKSGKILVGGQNAEMIPDEKKREIFGYVEQDFSLLLGTIREQVTMRDPNITDEQVKKALDIACLTETINSFENGLETKCTATQLSQGQLQLLSIARAVAKNPSILLLDEITANLDSSTEEQVMNALRAATENRTVVSISHRLYETSGSREIPLGSAFGDQGKSF